MGKKKNKLTSDGIAMSGDIDGVDVSFDLAQSTDYTMVGASTVDSLDPGTESFSYTFDDLNEREDLFEEDLRMKYPALQQAYDHYQAVKQMCETREKEENED
jgi:hypothetical protein